MGISFHKVALFWKFSALKELETVMLPKSVFTLFKFETQLGCKVSQTVWRRK